MQLIRQARDLATGGRKVCVAIGMFDGVHLGHQQVIKQAVFDARQHHGLSLAVTFDCHPATVLAPERAPRLIYSLGQKLREIERLGVDGTLLIHFDKEFSKIPGDRFIRELAASVGQIYCICVGRSFTFGHKRGGNVALLEALGRELHFHVHGLAAVSLNDEVVSSTRIRECISEGNLDSASQMLGRTYSISGRVTRGNQLGRKIGVPTANVDITGILTPPNGVYAVHAAVRGETYPAVANIGIRPTVAQNAEPRLEVHLLNFDSDLYDEELEVSFVEFIRPEQKFASVEALQSQIQADITTAREML